MPILTGNQVGELQAILANAFNTNGLVHLVKNKLNETLEIIVAIKQPLVDIAFDLIVWLEHRNRTRELLQAVKAERPTVIEIGNFCDTILLAAAPVAHGFVGQAKPVDPGRVLVMVVEFRTLFGQRQDLFRNMNAYKALHEVLHKLQDQKVAILDAARRFHASQEDQLELKAIADRLDDELVEKAKGALPKTEFPEDWSSWVGGFESAVQSLRSSLVPPDLGTLDRAVEILGNLHNQQAGLNGELVKCAKRFKTDKLVDKMEAILAGLSQLPQEQADELRAGLTQFRAKCQQLAALAIDHDACQKVDISLAAAQGATPSGVFKWPEVLADLLRIAARRPDDKKAARLAEYARAFDAATDSKAGTAHFTLLRGQFDRLFSRTDEDLFDVTGDLVNDAKLLTAKLERFA